MAEDTTTTETTTDVIGRRLAWIGGLAALVVGVIWLAQRNTHNESQADFGVFTGERAFDNTPYAIAFAIAVAVLVLGLVLRNARR